MSEASRIADQLKRSHAGPAWHGPSVRSVLSGVDARVASRRPPAKAHTIWEIANHLAAWNVAVLRRLDGDRLHLRGAEDWPPMPASPDATSWKLALRELEKSHAALLAAARKLPDRNLNRKTGSRPRDTIYENLLGTVQHYTYHAGQIMLLKRLVAH